LLAGLVILAIGLPFAGAAWFELKRGKSARAAAPLLVPYYSIPIVLLLWATGVKGIRLLGEAVGVVAIVTLFCYGWLRRIDVLYLRKEPSEHSPSINTHQRITTLVARIAYLVFLIVAGYRLLVSTPGGLGQVEIRFHTIIVFATSAGFFWVGVGILLNIAHSRRFTPQALRSWLAPLTGGLATVVVGYLSANQLPPERWRLAFALGAILGTLLRVALKRPQQSSSS
jgi:hypothetical protein